jgi:hypothetical protein
MNGRPGRDRGRVKNFWSSNPGTMTFGHYLNSVLTKLTSDKHVSGKFLYKKQLESTMFTETTQIEA